MFLRKAAITISAIYGLLFPLQSFAAVSVTFQGTFRSICNIRHFSPWLSLVDGLGTQVMPSGLSIMYISRDPDAFNNYFGTLCRGEFSFPTLGIPDGSQIQSATLQFFVVDKDDTANYDPVWSLVCAYPQVAGQVFVGDYSSMYSCSQPFGSGTQSNFNVGQYNSINLFTVGLNQINLSTTTVFGLREYTYDLGAVEPGVLVNRKGAYLQIESGNNNPPLLTVNYVPLGGSLDVDTSETGTVNDFWLEYNVSAYQFAGGILLVPLMGVFFKVYTRVKKNPF